PTGKRLAHSRDEVWLTQDRSSPLDADFALGRCGNSQARRDARKLRDRKRARGPGRRRERNERVRRGGSEGWKLGREVARQNLVGLRAGGETNGGGEKEHHRIMLLIC